MILREMTSMLRRLCLSLVLFGIAGIAVAEPHHILLIRHAEKPTKEDMAVDITPMGKMRADALFGLFEKSAARPEPFPRPDFLFAAKNSKSSHRCVETMAPLSEKLKLSLHAEIKNEDFATLAKQLLTEAKYTNKTILVAWHHGTMPGLAKALGASDAPATWPSASFDRVWEITYHAGGKITFRDRPQMLLPSDSK
jgi:hypothetical protein